MRPVTINEESRQHILKRHLDADGLRAAGLLKKLYTRALEAAREQEVSKQEKATQELGGGRVAFETMEVLGNEQHVQTV